MTSIGKFTTSAVSAVSEITVAAANLNFDFSLVKVEAPQEFQALGQVLSRGRRREAEEGTSHSTARKLAALFEPLLDRTPELFKAYGTRSSEIVSSREVNPLGSKEDHGLFFEQVGADCTSIWAAATSGHSAVAMHLLACMLARIWEPDQAISVWVDIVGERKRQIQADESLSGLEKLALDAAARQHVSREQLAQWDASARSWLQCADQATGIKTKQTQLLLILKNVAIAVNSITDTYKSVMQAWKSAMTLVENLIRGQPQEVRDGAILLGLSAWHLFPDLVVLGNTTTQVKQRDSLIASGGILTVGISETHSDEEHCGISWSLPLASLNFYGDPVTSTQTLDPDTPRLTSRDLAFVGLGSLLSQWDPRSANVAQAAECLVELWAFLGRNVEGFSLESAPSGGLVTADPLQVRPWQWLKMLRDAARAFLDARGVDKERAFRLLHFGRRRAEQFLSYNASLQTDFLGLLCSRTFIGSLRGTETKISYLRHWASEHVSHQEDTVIQYTVTKPSVLSEIRYRRSNSTEPADGAKRSEYALPDDDMAPLGEEYAIPEGGIFDTENSSTKGQRRKRPKSESTYLHFEYATAIQAASPGCKRGTTGAEVPTKCHKRWIAIISEKPMCSMYGKCTCEEHKLSSCNCERHSCMSTLKNHRREPALTEKRESDLSITGEWITLEEQRVIYRDPGYHGETLIWHGSPQVLSGKSKHSTRGQTYHVLWGNPGDAAIFINSKVDKGDTTKTAASSPTLISSWISALKNNSVCPETLQAILRAGAKAYEDYFTSLDALSIAYETFEAMPGATIDPKVASQPLKNSQWYRSYSTSQALAWEQFQQEEKRHNLRGMTVSVPAFQMSLKRSETFACIAFFDSGNIDVHPDHLHSVMAVSSGNSVYLALQLLEDPSKVGIEHQVRHIAGNIGQAGTGFLVPPAKPRVRAMNDSSWQVINHDSFDERVENCFEGTSCHLSFTNYRMPITLAHQVHGRQDVETYFIETVASIYDSGKWVADLDILSSLASMSLNRSLIAG
ncbi:serine threonine kinase [Fusarium subglutinans]|uniref:Serine threonine kinase n=1 Tax=Gibberella subglutinans TaxID=42677 RepID=A0A8H5P232_GIBSU|nr:serine threonine kinase [Fusarium subglutinans]KAF5587122.1 serine threonine kinase [Fusarium subglutinans]